MRRFGLALAVVLTAACSDGGAPATAPEQDAGEGFEIISAGEIVDAAFLDDLSEEDRAAVREALQAAAEEIREILARLRAGEIDRAEARALIDGVHVALIETLSEFLTEEQIERVLRHRPGQDRSGQDRPDQDRPDLDLTEEQLRLVEALREECREAVARVRGAVESGEITAEEGRRQVREIAFECRQEFCQILEPDQQAKVPFCRGPEEGRQGD